MQSEPPTSRRVKIVLEEKKENQIRKPYSGFIYFSQQFLEVIRHRFTYLTNQQVTRALAYRWTNLTRE